MSTEPVRSYGDHVARARLLFVVNNPAFLLSHRLSIACAAQKAGWDVHVATPDGPAVADLVSEGFVHHAIPLDRVSTRPIQELGAVLALWRLYRRLRPTIVHHVTIKPVLYGGIAARWARVPAVVSAVSGLGYVFAGHSMRQRLLRRIGIPLYRLALRHRNGRAVLQNANDRATLERIGALGPEAPVMTQGSGVDLDQYTPRPEPQGPETVVLPARLLREKGVLEFVEAARVLQRRGVNARFVLAGDLDQKNPSGIDEATVRAWCEEGVIEWWGHCDDMPGAFAASHLVVLPSFYGEGMPKALMEACACGRAVVTTDMPGCRDVVTDGINGILVPAQEIPALADAIEELLSDPERRQEMGRRGRLRAETEFSVHVVVRQHLQLYEELGQVAGQCAGGDPAPSGNVRLDRVE